MIYLISPYTHQNPLVRAERARKVGRVALALAEEGIMSISPVFYGHQLEEKFHVHLPYEFWLSWSRGVMAKCSAAYVVALPGWRESRGVREECKLAVELSMPITGYQIADAEEVSGLDIRKEFDLPIVKVKGMRSVK